METGKDGTVGELSGEDSAGPNGYIRRRIPCKPPTTMDTNHQMESVYSLLLDLGHPKPDSCKKPHLTLRSFLKITVTLDMLCWRHWYVWLHDAEAK